MGETEATQGAETAAHETAATRRNGKSPAAFRTTGEVAAALGLPAYVLRFWEAKFPQLQPVKRGGGRRYYRPQDVDLLRRIQQCLYQEGYTIRGVQKLLRDGALRGEELPRADDETTPARCRARTGRRCAGAREWPGAVPARPCARRSKRCGATSSKSAQCSANCEATRTPGDQRVS